MATHRARWLWLTAGAALVASAVVLGGRRLSPSRPPRPPKLERVQLSGDGRGFVLAPPGRPFRPWGGQLRQPGETDRRLLGGGMAGRRRGLPGAEAVGGERRARAPAIRQVHGGDRPAERGGLG